MRDYVSLACLLEATAKKPGNVHPEARFSDMTYDDFVASADAIAPVFNDVASQSVGSTILKSVQATQAAVGKNTNLGSVLLLAPLATAAHAVNGLLSKAVNAEQRLAALKQGVFETLLAMTNEDAVLAFQAIRLAQPGGLGTVERNDISGEPTGTLRDVMRSAADRDLIAAEYAYGFRMVLDHAVPTLIRDWPQSPDNWEQHVVRTHLHLMSIRPDSLISRKCGQPIARDSARRARDVLDTGWPDTQIGRRRFVEFDQWLRADGNRRNPGTTADLVAAALFAALCIDGITAPPVPTFQ